MKITGLADGEKGNVKRRVNNGLREVKVVSLIRTYNCVGDGTEGNLVRNECQYWTDEGEEIGSKTTHYDHLGWMEFWMENYEKQVGDGKAKSFYEWIFTQPMPRGD